MAVNKIVLDQPSTDRGRSGSLWKNFPIAAIQEDNAIGVFDGDEFMSIPKTPPTTEGNWGRYAAFTDTGGTMAQDTTELGGAVAIGSDGDNEGASFRTVVTPFQIGQGKGVMCFECRILTSTIADTKHNVLVGLMEDTALTATIPITAAGAIGDKNLVGFRRTEAVSGGALIDFVYKANGVTAVTVQAGIATLVASTYVKLGFRFEPSGDKAGNYALSSYVNGTRQTTVKLIPSAAGTDFPNDISLGFFFAVLNATGTTPGTSSMDWWYAGQLF